MNSIKSKIQSFFSFMRQHRLLSIMVGTVIVVAVIGVFLLLRHPKPSESEPEVGPTFAFQGEYPDPVTVELIDDEGNPYTIEAIEGQVCVWFSPKVTYSSAKQSIQKAGGQIVAQIPQNGYYLVQISADEVRNFLDRMKSVPGIERAFPNMVSYPCTAYNYILDNYNPDLSDKNDTTPHGVIVEEALKQFGSESPLKPYNIGTNNGKSMCVKSSNCTNNAVFAINEIANSSVKGPIIINMSFGPSLPPRADSIRYYWDSATNKERDCYKELYKQTIQDIIQALQPLAGKDFIVTKSAGNNGVKVFDSAIITYLRKKLDPDEIKFIDDHFIFVTAKDDDRGEYSNEMEVGRYDPWVTKVDISDFKYHGKRRYGTSYAAPRAAGFLSSVASEFNLSGAEVLQFAREATKTSTEPWFIEFRGFSGVLTKCGLVDCVLNHGHTKPAITLEGTVKMVVNSDEYDVTIYEFLLELDRPTNLRPFIDYCDELSWGCWDWDENERIRDDDGKIYSDVTAISLFWVSDKKEATESARQYANKRVRVTGNPIVSDGTYPPSTECLINNQRITIIK